MAICKLCKNERELQESHIVPEFMYRPLYNEKHKTVGYLLGRGKPKPQFVQKGRRWISSWLALGWRAEAWKPGEGELAAVSFASTTSSNLRQRGIRR